MRVRVPEVKESTALGAAIYAGLGAGLYADLDEVVRGLVRFERTVDPDPAAARAYRDPLRTLAEGLPPPAGALRTGLLRPLLSAAGT